MASARSRRPVSLALGLAAASAVALATVAGTTPAVAAEPSGGYVALGDSYAAGPFIPIQHGNPPGCARSSQNYPSLVAADLGYRTFTDVTCSGATTADMTQPQAVPFGPNPAQFTALNSRTKLVTITISGNDIGFSDIAATCAKLGIGQPLGDPCAQHYGDTISRQIDAVAPKVAGVLAEIHRRAPAARVAVVGYLRILPHTVGCFPVNPFAVDDVPFLDGVERELNGMLATEAKDAHDWFVDTYGPSAGHDSCTPEGTRWVEPLAPIGPVAPLHPNAIGMRAVAGLTESAVIQRGRHAAA